MCVGEESHMKPHLLAMLVLAGLAAVVSGCIFGGEAPPPAAPPQIKPVEIIDLDKVLNVLSETLDEMDIERISKADAKEFDALAARPGAAGKGPLAAARDINQEAEAAFVARLVAKLNAARVWSQPVGVAILSDGRLQGFLDPNRNNQKEGAGEKELFSVTLDEPRGRLIASDLASNFHRAAEYGFADRGMFSGYLLAAMLKRQRDVGADVSRLATVSVSPPGYHAAAVAAARKRAEAAAAAAQQQKK